MSGGLRLAELHGGSVGAAKTAAKYGSDYFGSEAALSPFGTPKTVSRRKAELGRYVRLSAIGISSRGGPWNSDPPAAAYWYVLP